MPAYAPQLWNTPTSIVRNNCYSYAIDRRDDVPRDPGSLAGMGLVAPMFCADGKTLTARAERDGLVSTGVVVLPIQNQTPNVWPVALVVAPIGSKLPPGHPYGDYHWYRRDEGGLWSHKAGYGNPATDVDDDGNQIIDPTVCSRGEYSLLVGFFVVERRKLKR